MNCQIFLPKSLHTRKKPPPPLLFVPRSFFLKNHLICEDALYALKHWYPLSLIFSVFSFRLALLGVIVHPTPSHSSNHHLNRIIFSSPTDCVCVGRGRDRRRRERERERERESGLSQSVRVFVCYFRIYFVSCNGPCAPKEKWHRKERINYHYCCYYYYDLSAWILPSTKS